MLEIRSFAETDRAALRSFFRRAGEDAPTAFLWGHADSEAAVYVDPYMDLVPDSLFVAAVDGSLAGYLTGCLDPSLLPSESDRMTRAVKTYRLMLRAQPTAFLARSMTDVLGAAIRRAPTPGELHDDRWPAHLHINIEPAARGTGAASGLMHRWFDQLREADSPGCHRQTLCENTRAVRFFERMGFVKRGPTPLVPRLRQYGRRLHQQTMVWSQ